MTPFKLLLFLVLIVQSNNLLHNTTTISGRVVYLKSGLQIHFGLVIFLLFSSLSRFL